MRLLNPQKAVMAGGGQKNTFLNLLFTLLVFLEIGGPDDLADFSKDTSVSTKAHWTRGRQRTRKP